MPGSSTTFLAFVLLGIVLRVALIVYGEHHDRHSVLKYSDVDYRVFSDAARFILRRHHVPDSKLASGPLASRVPFAIGDPYDRDTYRYTPLLALLLLPNELVHATWGKWLFASCDIGIGLVLFNIFLRTTKSRSDKPTNAAWWVGGLWILNPMVANISTRGSAESVLGLMVVSSLGLIIQGKDELAAIVLGLAVHFKIYPVIYGTSVLAVLAAKEAQLGRGIVKGWGSWRQIKFGLLCGGTFLVMGGLMYSVWGLPFLEHTYLYHISRRDHRHNFSLYFYPTYLSYPASGASPVAGEGSSSLLESPLLSFVPQMVLSLGSGLLLGAFAEDLPFVWLVQTMAFVNFNKVCTSQYFMWYLWFLPLVLPRLRMSIRRSITVLGVWVASQALWLSLAYQLEFLGREVFLKLWLASAAFLVGQNYVLVQVILSAAGYDPQLVTEVDVLE